MCYSTVYVFGKASGQQSAISSQVLGESKVIHRLLTMWGVGTPNQLFKGQLYSKQLYTNNLDKLDKRDKF